MDALLVQVNIDAHLKNLLGISAPRILTLNLWAFTWILKQKRILYVKYVIKNGLQLLRIFSLVADALDVA